MVFIHNLHTSKQTALLFSSIGSFGWISFSSFFILFILALAGKEKILQKKWFYLLAFAVPLILIFKQWTGFIFGDVGKEYYGWKPLLSSTIWPHYYYIYYICFMAVGFYINIKLIKHGKGPVIKKQAKIIFTAVIITLSLGSVTDVILPLLNNHVIPNIGSSFLLIWAFAVVYAMVKYKFLVITPAAAAANIISTMFDSLFFLNMTGKIEMTNKAAVELSGYKEEELIGKRIGTLFGEYNIERGAGTGPQPMKVDETIPSRLKNLRKKTSFSSMSSIEDGPVEEIILEGNLKNRDFIFKTKDGKSVPVLFSSSLLKDEAGAAGGVVCVVKDISERKKLEEEVLKSKKLESIGILAGGIAHDFNNLLTIIMLNLSQVQDTMDPGDKTYELLQKADDTSQKAADLTGEFLLLIPGTPLTREEAALSIIFKNVWESGLQESTIDFDIDLPADLYSIYGDESRLNRVMRNLFLNAGESMPDGGRITVRAENITIQTESKLLLKPGRYVKVLISDTGSGIQQEYMDRIFDPYFSTKETITDKGMGLGLTICYAIIKKHEGHIAVASRKGEGTTVTLYLPAYSTV